MSHSQSFPQPPGQQPNGLPQQQPSAPPLQQGVARSEYMQKAPWRRPSASWGQAIKLWWKNILVFHGRASRSEYWWMVLSLALASLALGIIGSMIDMAFLGSQAVSSDDLSESMAPTPGSTVVNIVSFFLSLSMIPLSVRRMHDINRSGWWVLVFQLVSLVVTIVAVFTLVMTILAIDAADKAGASTPEVGGPLVGFFVACAIGLAVWIWSLVWHATDSKMDGTRFDLNAPKLPEPQHANWAPANPVFAQAQAQAQVSAQPQGQAPGQIPGQFPTQGYQQPGHEQPASPQS